MHWPPNLRALINRIYSNCKTNPVRPIHAWSQIDYLEDQIRPSLSQKSVKSSFHISTIKSEGHKDQAIISNHLLKIQLYSKQATQAEKTKQRIWPKLGTQTKSISWETNPTIHMHSVTEMCTAQATLLLIHKY